MSSMSIAKLAKLLHLNAVWMFALIFACGVVTLLTLGARQCYDNPHDVTPPTLV